MIVRSEKLEFAQVYGVRSTVVEETLLSAGKTSSFARRHLPRLG